MDPRIEKTRQTYENIAEDWAMLHSMDDWWIPATDRFVALLHPGSRVLDAGCGQGCKSRYLLGMGLWVLGIDFSGKMVEIAARQNPSGDFQVMDLRDVSGLEPGFGGIYAGASLLHIPKAEVPSIISALAAKLDPGGHFYAAVKAKRDGGPAEEMKVDDDIGRPYERFFSYYDLAEMIHFFGLAGLRIAYEKQSRVGKTCWIEIIGMKG